MCCPCWHALRPRFRRQDRMGFATMEFSHPRALGGPSSSRRPSQRPPTHRGGSNASCATRVVGPIPSACPRLDHRRTCAAWFLSSRPDRPSCSSRPCTPPLCRRRLRADLCPPGSQWHSAYRQSVRGSDCREPSPGKASRCPGVRRDFSLTEAPLNRVRTEDRKRIANQRQPHGRNLDRGESAQPPTTLA